MIVSQLVCSPFSDHNSLYVSLLRCTVKWYLRCWRNGRRNEGDVSDHYAQETWTMMSHVSLVYGWRQRGLRQRRRSPLLLDTLVEQRTMRSCWRCLAVTPPTHTIATVDMLVTVTLENLPNDCLMISELSTYTITCIEYNTHSENLIVKSVVLKGYNHEHKLRSNSEKNRVKRIFLCPTIL